jgi:hypothetical protein
MKEESTETEDDDSIKYIMNMESDKVRMTIVSDNPLQGRPGEKVSVKIDNTQLTLKEAEEKDKDKKEKK